MTNANDPRTVATTLVQLVDRQDWPALLELVAPAVRVRVGGMELDRDGWMGMGKMFYAAFPDARHEIERVLVDGEHAIVLARFRGTHRGELMGIPATGRAVEFSVIHVDRVVDGRVVEHRGELDSAGLMQQLGTPPAELRAVVDEMFRRIDGRDWPSAIELIAPECRFRVGSQTMTREQWRGFSEGFYRSFPDGRHEHEVIVAGDRAIEIGRYVGTHRGDFQGIAPTGRRVSFGYIGVTRVVDGKVVDQQVEIDSAALMQQLQ
jgi:predicted ester cyclase